jgi:prepilin-type processing-associated H-X9-DG protein
MGQHKGLSGFNPSQPCPGSTQVAPQFALIKTMNYAFWTADLAAQHAAVDTSDKADIVRVKWDRHSGGANYSFADGHAKYLKLGQVLDQSNYKFGEKFYPGFASYNTTACTN